MPRTKSQQPVRFRYRERKQTTTKPKKNKSAFLLFSDNMRLIFKQNDINLPSNQAMKKLAQLWHEIDPNEKKKFEDLAHEDKERYLRQKDEFLLSHPGETLGNRTKKNHVRKPWSAYDFFVHEKFPHSREENPTLETGDIIKIISKQWRSLFKQERSVYEERAARDKKERMMDLKKLVQEDSMCNVYTFANDRREEDDDDEDEKVISKPKKKVKTTNIQPIKIQQAVSSQARNSVLSKHPLFSEEDEIYENSELYNNVNSDEKEGSLLKFCMDGNYNDMSLTRRGEAENIQGAANSFNLNQRSMDLYNVTPIRCTGNENIFTRPLGRSFDRISNDDDDNLYKSTYIYNSYIEDLHEIS